MRQLLTFTLLLLLSGNITANTLRILDKSGSPLRDAVITVLHKQDNKASTYKIIQNKFKFIPEVLVINAGDTVLFPNKDKVIHHIYSFSSTGIFEMYLDKGETTYSMVFEKPGIAILGCNIHDSMTGYIHVLNDQKHLKTNRKGTVTFRDDIPASIEVWHPNMAGSKTERLTLIPKKEGRNKWVVRTNIANLNKIKKNKNGRY